MYVLFNPRFSNEKMNWKRHISILSLYYLISLKDSNDRSKRLNKYENRKDIMKINLYNFNKIDLIYLLKRSQSEKLGDQYYIR